MSKMIWVIRLLQSQFSFTSTVYTKQSDATVAASALAEKIARFLSDLDSDIMKTEIVSLSHSLIGNAALTGPRNGAQFLIIIGELVVIVSEIVPLRLGYVFRSC